MELPDDLLEGATLRGREYGWPPSVFPAIVARAQEHGLGCLGGQFQFRVPRATCEMYWLNADPSTRSSDEPWPQYVARTCTEVLAGFRHLLKSTDFRAEAARWADVPELSGPSASPEQYLCFVAYFVEQGAAPNNSSKPTPLRGAA